MIDEPTPAPKTTTTTTTTTTAPKTTTTSNDAWWLVAAPTTTTTTAPKTTTTTAPAPSFNFNDDFSSLFFLDDTSPTISALQTEAQTALQK